MAMATVNVIPDKVLCHITVERAGLRGARIRFYGAQRADGWRKVELGRVKCRSRPSCESDAKQAISEWAQEGWVPLVSGIGEDKCPRGAP